MSVVLVCGGRDYEDNEQVNFILSFHHAEVPIELLIEGGARGADTHANYWATDRGIHVAQVKANWNKYGRAAGWKRNAAMLLLKPDFVIAFPGGAGTASMVNLAKARGVTVIEVKP